MKVIKTINQLDITNGNLTAHGENIFLRQGSMDGACGPYCVFMALLVLGVIDYHSATNLWLINKSTKLGKLIKALMQHETLFQNGTFAEDLETMLQQSYSKDIITTTNNLGGRKVIDFTVESLKNNAPVVVGIRGKDLAHWLLAVGFEENNGKLSKLFLLDPSANEETNYWNSVIRIDTTYHGIYSYKWENSEDLYVKFEDAISINLKNRSV